MQDLHSENCPGRAEFWRQLLQQCTERASSVQHDIHRQGRTSSSWTMNIHNQHSNHTNHSVTTPTTIFNKGVGGHQRRHTGMSLLFSKTDWQVQFIVSFVTAPFHSYYRMSLYRLVRPLHFKHVGVNVRLRLTHIQSVRSVSNPSWGSRSNFSLVHIFNTIVI